MTVLLLVEGQSDRRALPILARRLVDVGVGVTALKVGKGDLLSAQKTEVHIRYALARQRDVNKVVLCIDSECTDIGETRARIDAVAREVAGRLPQVSTRAVVVDHSLEGWLLVDRQALARHLGLPEGRLLRYGDPENECRPAELMARVFRQARRDFLKTDALPALAERMDVRLVAQGSPTFATFRQALVSA